MTTVLTTPVTVFFVVVGAFVVGVVVGVGVGAVVVGVVVGAGEVGVFVVPAPAPSLPDLVTGTFGVLGVVGAVGVVGVVGAAGVVGVVGAVVDPPPDEPLESPLPDCEPEPLGFALVFDFVFLTYLFC